MKVLRWQGGSAPVFTCIDEPPQRPSLQQQLREMFGKKPQSVLVGSWDAPIAKPAPLTCSACGQPSHQGRKMFCPNDTSLCGDCVAGGTPLVAPKVEPLTAEDCCAWQTACDEGVD